MKNDILFSKGKTKFVPDMGTRGTCTGAKLPEIMTLAQLQTGVLWRNF